MNPMLSRRALLVLSALGGHGLASAQAGSWPNKTIRIVVPFPAGGAPDALTRRIGDELARTLNASVVTENRPGASGILGVQAMASQPPDGHTIVLISTGHVTASAMSPKFDLLRDTRVVTQVVNSPLILVVNPSSSYQSLSDLFKAIQEQPGKLTFGSAGSGSSAHMGIEFLAESVSGFKVVHIPYKGTIEFANAIMAKDIDFAISAPGVVIPLIKGGKLRALGVTSASRLMQLPDVPAIAETVVGYNFGAWMGFAAHKDTPEPILNQLNKALIQAASSDAVKQLAQQGAFQIDLTSSPNEFAAAIQRELVKERVTVKRLGLSLAS